MRRVRLNPVAGGLLVLAFLACGSRSGGGHDRARWWGDLRQPEAGDGTVPSTGRPPLPPALQGLDDLAAGAWRWAYGIPDQPALDLDLPGITGIRPRGFWPRLPRLLFAPDPGGQWRRRGFYRPWMDGHGPLQRLRALEDGTFIATSGLWFRDGGRVSPCARYALDGTTELRFQELVNPQPDTPLPASVPASGDPASPWTSWAPRRAFTFLLAGDHVLALVNLVGDCLTPLNPRNGRPLVCIPFPRSSSGQRLTVLALHPGPGGTMLLEGDWPTHAGARERTPGDRLAAALLGLPPSLGKLQPAAFRLEPGSVAWRTVPPSPELVDLLREPREVATELTLDGRIRVSPRMR
jgi:hypothetical protein